MKTKPKHTPGPWRIGPENAGDGRNILAGKSDYIGHTCGYQPRRGSSERKLTQAEADANAALIASAPELLKERDELKDALCKMTAKAAALRVQRDKLREALQSLMLAAVDVRDIGNGADSPMEKARAALAES